MEGQRNLSWMVNRANDTIADYLEYFHDFCMVWAPPFQGISVVDCNRSQLDDRLCGVLFSGARKQDRLLPVLYGAVEDDSGSHHADRVFGVFGDIPSRTIPVELHRGVWIYHRCRILHVL